MKHKKKLEPYLFVLPAAALILFIYLIPFVFSIVISLTDWNGISREMNFVGLDNFLNIFKEPAILEVLKNNVIYFVEIVLIQNTLAIFIAALLRDKFKGRNFFRAVLFMPTVVCTVAVAFIWNLMLDPVSGYIPALFEKLGMDFLANILWLGNSSTAIHTVSFVNIWQWTGWSMVIYLAGMMSIDESLYEAAGIDGSSRWQKFRHVTLPLLAPSLTVNLVTTSIGAFKIYDLPFVMTSGGPGHSSESLAITVYANSFTYNKMGYGSAISLILFLFILIISIVQMKYMRKREDGVL